MKALCGRVRLGKVFVRAGKPVALPPAGDVRAAVSEVGSWVELIPLTSGCMYICVCVYVLKCTSRFTALGQLERKSEIWQSCCCVCEQTCTENQFG